jgi:hypothetical protein
MRKKKGFSTTTKQKTTSQHFRFTSTYVLQKDERALPGNLENCK